MGVSVSSPALQRPIQTIGELIAQIDNLRGDLVRLQARRDDDKLLLIEVLDVLPSGPLKDRVIKATCVLPYQEFCSMPETCRNHSSCQRVPNCCD
jgi:hypothetical protein